MAIRTPEGSRMRLRVALAQFPVSESVEENRAAALRALELAAAGEADILLTPEGSVSGYTHEFDARAVGEAVDEIAPSGPREGSSRRTAPGQPSSR